MASARMSPRSSGDLHATAVAVDGRAVLIRGVSRSGKSSLALALIATANRDGVPACLVGDDRILVEAADGRLTARGHPLIRGLIERRGVGVVKLPFAEEAEVRLVVDLPPPCGASSAAPSCAACAGTAAAGGLSVAGVGVVTLEGVSLARLEPGCARAVERARCILRRIGHGDVLTRHAFVDLERSGANAAEVQHF